MLNNKAQYLWVDMFLETYLIGLLYEVAIGS